MTDLAMPDGPLWKVSRPIRQALPRLPAPAARPQKRDDGQRPPSSRSEGLPEPAQHTPSPLPPVYTSASTSSRRPQVFPTIPLSTAASIKLDPVSPADSKSSLVSESRSSLSNMQPLSPIGCIRDASAGESSNLLTLDDSPNDSLLAVMAARIAELEATIEAMQLVHDSDELPQPTPQRPWPSALVPNIQLLQAQVATLNSFAAAPASVVVAVNPADRSARLVKKVEHVQLVVFKDGMCLDDCLPMIFGEPAAMQVLRDLEDGYFPELLKERYPNGVPIHLVDKSKYSLHAAQVEPFPKSPSPIRASRQGNAEASSTLVHRPPSSPAATSSHSLPTLHQSCPILTLSATPTTAFPLKVKVHARTGPLAIVHCDARDTPRALVNYLRTHGLLPAALDRSFRPGRPLARATPGFWMHKGRGREGESGGEVLDEDVAFVDVLGEASGLAVVLFWD